MSNESAVCVVDAIVFLARAFVFSGFESSEHYDDKKYYGEKDGKGSDGYDDYKNRNGGGSAMVAVCLGM